MSRGKTDSRWHHPWGWMVVLILLSLWPYHQVGGFHFINWDDPFYITNNALVQQGLSWSGALSVWKLAHPYPMPLAYLAFMAQVEWLGMEAGSFHWVGLVGHVINTLLFFALARRLTDRLWVSLLAALWFSLHPLRVEAVVWISEQKEIGAALFGLLALHGYLSHVQKGAPSPWLSLALLFYLLSMLFKPQWVTLPVLLLLLDGWPLQRHLPFAKLVGEKWGFFAISLCFAVLTLFSFDNHGRLTAMESLPLQERLANMVAYYGGFIEDTILPLGLTPYHPFVHQWQVGWLLFLGVMCGGVVWYRQRWPWLFMSWWWFMMALLPLSGLFAGGEAICRADRWSYLPHMGLFLGLAYLVGTLSRPWTVLAIISLPFLAWLSNQQSLIWQNSETLWQHAIGNPISRESYYPRILLGKHYLEHNQPERALPLFEEARRMEPHHPLVALELANLLAAFNQPQAAWSHYEVIPSLAKTTPKLLATTAMAFLLNRQYQEAVYYLGALLQRWPDAQLKESIEARFMLAVSLEATGRGEESLVYIQQYLGDAPGNRCALAQTALDNLDGLSRFPKTNQHLNTLCHPQ
ncbi:MAG: tetratricopeptide repeat protein [Magnetococcales bacterium]|nr:tetratricopeptide repeat protein [Magnetococcales bacterium]